MFDSLLESTTTAANRTVTNAPSSQAHHSSIPVTMHRSGLSRSEEGGTRSTTNTTAHAPIPNDITDISDTLETLEPFTETGIPCEIEQSITELIETTGGAQQPSLSVCYASDAVRELYEVKGTQYSSDSGWDLRFTEDILVAPGETVKCDFGLSVCAHNERGMPSAVLMLPRSSIVKTPLRMANSVGLIDSSYRGTLKAFVDNIKTEPYQIKRGDRLFQLIAPSAVPFQITEAKELPVSDRGANGFGSTGQ
jgi:dUTP pyrophosphatase